MWEGRPRVRRILTAAVDANGAAVAAAVACLVDHGLVTFTNGSDVPQPEAVTRTRVNGDGTAWSTRALPRPSRHCVAER